MAKFVLKGARLFAGGTDFTSNNSKIELKTEIEEKDVTAFNPNSATEVWTEVLGGLASTEATAEGQWEAGDSSKVDDSLWAARGSVSSLTVCPAGASYGSLAWLTKALTGSYSLGGNVGDVAPWQADWAGTWPLVRGVILHPPGTARTATGNGNAVQHVAVGAGQYLYAGLHILSASGTTPSITVQVSADSDNTFATPVTPISFTAASAVGGEVVRVAGPLTDAWFKAKWTISGTSPSFLFVVSLGVAAA